MLKGARSRRRVAMSKGFLRNKGAASKLGVIPCVSGNAHRDILNARAFCAHELRIGKKNFYG
jgi:hypothetical protein